MSHASPSRDLSGARASAGRAGAFTLIELVVVMVMVAILAVVAAPSLAGLDRTRELGAARSLLADLTFARQRGVATGTRTWISFSLPGAWTILEEDPDEPGLDGARPIIEHASGVPLSRTIGSADTRGVSITRVDFDGTLSVGFDWLGSPLSADGESLSATGVVAITGGHELRVEPGTGHAHLEVAP